ncbi:MAG: hypothetical protein NVSMB34_14720 [Variovorax sp.]
MIEHGGLQTEAVFRLLLQICVSNREIGLVQAHSSRTEKPASHPDEEEVVGCPRHVFPCES